MDDDPSEHFAAGGVPVRMALISLLLGMAEQPEPKGSFRLGGTVPTATPHEEEPPTPEPLAAPGIRCGNPKCVTQKETYLEMKALQGPGGKRCAYCEHPV